jgi:PIN domain nuclease of toxin-antitoxin system
VSGYVADTHAHYWYLTDSPRLGQKANEAFDEADAGRAPIYVPAIALAELFYMNDKLARRLDLRSTLYSLLCLHPGLGRCLLGWALQV